MSVFEDPSFWKVGIDFFLGITTWEIGKYIWR
jgi:hypothetical protein